MVGRMWKNGITYIAVENVKWHGHLKKNPLAVSHKTKAVITIQLSNYLALLVIYSREIKTYVDTNICIRVFLYKNGIVHISFNS